MEYFAYCLGLSLCLYWVPAIALYPQALRQPLYFSVLPILSVLIIGVLTTGLLALGAFTPAVVWAVTGGLSLIAGLRLQRMLPIPSAWSGSAYRSSVINLLILLPYAVRLGTTAFDRADELCSWNYWALQYVEGLCSVDFRNTTQVPYPQFFSKWLAYAYQWMGDTQLQLPLRATLIWFPWVLLQTLSLLAIPNIRTEWIGRLGMIFVLYGTNIQRYFEIGYADPLLCASLLSSVALWCYYLRQPSRPALWLAVACGITAAYSKQPGLFWVTIGFPLCLCLVPDKYYRRDRFLAVFVLWSTAVLWYWGEGQNFQYNGGVLETSLENRNYLGQLTFAANKYLVHQPIFLGVLALCAWTVWPYPAYRRIYWGWLLPSTLLWFLFGAYHLRLGVHNVLGAWLLCAATDFRFFPQTAVWIRPLHAHAKNMMIGLAVLSLSVCSYQVYRSGLYVQGAPSIYHAGQVALARYFGQQWSWVFENIYDNSKIVLWCPTNYQYALFYGHTAVLRPEYERYPDFTEVQAHDLKKIQAIFLEEMRAIQPDYVFSLGNLPTRGAFISSAVEQLAIEKPGLLQEVIGPPNRYDYHLYRFNKDVLGR